jgi:hypothetical protein
LSHASNLAHVLGVSGALVVSGHSPYDRQMLREHVDMLVSRASTLILGMHGARWIITRGILADVRCATCAHLLGRLSCSRVDEATSAQCIDCALQPHRHEHMDGQVS